MKTVNARYPVGMITLVIAILKTSGNRDINFHSQGQIDAMCHISELFQ